jgi:malonate-semialdehyde dehydrogenase (acetylating)/methylmalonate-semialdehyde dehydrogenase
MIPLWKCGPAIACGNAFILKPSERDPSVPMRIAELFLEAGLPPGILNVVNGDKEAVDTLLTDPRIQAVGFVGSSAIAEYIYATGCGHGKRVQCFGGAKNHMIVMPDADMDQAVDALIGAGYGSAGERCMAVSVAVPVGEKTADKLMEKLVPRVESLRIGPSTDAQADYGPMVTRQLLEKVRGYVDTGVKEGAKLVVDGRGFKLQGYENGYFMGGCLFDNVTPDMTIYKDERRCGCRRRTPTATASRSSPATATRRATSRAACRSAWSASTSPSPCRCPITPSAAGNVPASATSTSTGRIRSASIPRPRPSPPAGRPAPKKAPSSPSRP